MDKGGTEPGMPNIIHKFLTAVIFLLLILLQVFCLQLRHWLSHQELITIDQVGNAMGGKHAIFLPWE